MSNLVLPSTLDDFVFKVMLFPSTVKRIQEYHSCTGVFPSYETMLSIIEEESQEEFSKRYGKYWYEDYDDASIDDIFYDSLVTVLSDDEFVHFYFSFIK